MNQAICSTTAVRSESFGELMSQARPNGRCTDQTVSPTRPASTRKRSMAASRSSVDFPRSELSVTSTWPNPASLTCCNLSAGMVSDTDSPLGQLR